MFESIVKQGHKHSIMSLLMEIKEYLSFFFGQIKTVRLYYNKNRSAWSIKA